jgi:hypothetical protein
MVEKPGSLLVEIPACFDSCGHFGNFELRDLKGGERLSKLFPFSNMFDRLLHGSLGEPDRFRTDMEARVIKENHKLLESSSSFSDEIFFWNSDVAKRNVSRV